MKTCTKCNEVKPLDDFHRQARSKDGRQPKCKQCAIELAASWAKANKERVSEAAKARYASKPKEWHDAERARKKAALEANGDEIRAKKRAKYWENREANLERMRAYQQTPQAKVRARERYEEWKARHPRGALKATLANTYGLTLEDYDAMVVAQSGRCAICSDPMVSPAVDHCHDTGKVRALLCTQCNVGLGSFRDSPNRLASAIEYLNRTGTAKP